MDYNDNDREGLNLQLTSEESSKTSSVSQPYALPKFDFDGSLHEHLRFDTLVENEVFFGIQHQEDNQWIEDFSRGGNEIEFSSGAAESCPLPRHINVWSEATSSESVEMLLKAVGQEEMVQGENMVEESDPGDQLVSLTRQMENSLRKDGTIGDVDCANSSLPPTGIEGNISSSNQGVALEGASTEHIVQVPEAKLSSDEVGFGSKPTENSNVDLKEINSKSGETFDSVNEALTNQVKGNIPLLGSESNFNESSSQNIIVSLREPVAQDKYSDVSFASASCIAEGISDSVEEQDGCKENKEKLKGISVESDNREGHFSRENLSKMEPLKEEQAVKTSITNFGEVSDMPGEQKSASVNEFQEVVLVEEPAGCSQHGTVVLSSGTETAHLYNMQSTCSLLHENLAVSTEGQCIEGLGVNSNDVVTSITDDKSKPSYPVIIFDKHQSLAGNDDNGTGSSSSLEAQHSTVESSVLHQGLGNLSEKDGEENANPSDDPGNSEDFTIAGKFREEKLVVDGTSDTTDSCVRQKEIVEDTDHAPTPPIAGSLQTCKEDVTSMRVDSQEEDLCVSVREKEDKKLPLDSSNMVHDGKKEEGSTFLGGVNIETTTRSQPNSSAGDYAVLKGEDTKSTSSSIECKELVDCHEHHPPSCDMGCGVQSKAAETEVLKPPNTLVSEEILESNEIAPATVIKKAVDLVVKEKTMSNQSISVLETSSIAMPDEGCAESNKMKERSVNDLRMQDDGAETSPTEKPIEEEKGKNHGTNSSTLSVTSCTVGLDRSDKVADPGTSCNDHSQSELNKGATVETINAQNSGQVLTNSDTPVVNVSSKEYGTFTFDVRPLGSPSTGDSPMVLPSFPRIQDFKPTLAGEGSPSSGSSQMDAMKNKEIPHVSSSTTGVYPPSGGPTEHKARRRSGKSGKGIAKKGNQVKETTPRRQLEKGGKSSQFLSPLGAGQLMAIESVLNPRSPVSISTCSLPDLNTSAPSSAVFQQPFTDLQQVQLRAQIFVYGSLIQGAAPDEACMFSAFGKSEKDGGKSIWEPSWHACVERHQNKKSQGSNSETPGASRSGVKALDDTNRPDIYPSEAISFMTSQASSKALLPIPSPAVNPTSSPMWSMAAPSGEALPPSSKIRSSVSDYQAASPLNLCQTPPIRNYVAHSSGPLQAPFPVPWFASSHCFGSSSNYPAFPIMEPLKLTPAKDTSFPVASGTKYASPISATLTGATTVFSGTASLDPKQMQVSIGQTPDTKTRKRKKSSGADVVPVAVATSLVDALTSPGVGYQLSKKAPAVEGLNQISLIGPNLADSMPKPVIGSHYTTSIAIATPPSVLPKNTTNQFSSVVPPSISTDCLDRGDLSIDKRALDIEDFSKVEEAKLQAEEAAAHATAAVNHCEGVWSQLDHQKNSGLTLEAENKLSSAAVTIATAASVAKAAAAAAKIASSVAVQAKQMANEAVIKSGPNNSELNAVLVSNAMNLANAPPVSILKGGNWNSTSSLVISAAREAARKRIEAASAATRHAENLDTIVRAAELAAEAVSHAKKIVTMGDPLLLSELAVAGQSNHWKALQVAATPGSEPDDLSKKRSINSNPSEVPNVYVDQHEGPYADMHVSPIEREPSRDLVPGRVTVENNLKTLVKSGEKSSKPQKDKKASNRSKSGGVSDSDIVPGIKEGSHVEILKNHGNLKKAWFTATILSLKDVEALVCYTELKPDEGSEPLKEWIPLEAKGGDAPKIRIPHPMTVVQFEGTKKRRRAVVKDYTWSVGDRVDAWMQDCWCEGVITEKSSKDATTFSVHFPAQGETLKVKRWHLRPTLIWSDGQWTEWCRPDQDSTSQGDTPAEKRAKLGGMNIETKGEANMAKNLVFGETGRNEEPTLPLSVNEKGFNISSTREESKSNMVGTMRSGLEKTGSRVLLGAPKPGKKQKFMEVSKHYVSDRSTKTHIPSDSAKLAKYMTHQGSGSQGIKKNPKLDSKEKQVAGSKTRAPKSSKPPSIPSRGVPKNDGLTTSSQEHDAEVSDQALMGSISNDENESAGHNLTEFGTSSNIDENSGGSLASSQALQKEYHKNVGTRNTKTERGNEGNIAAVSEKSAEDEANETSISEAAEPRRSNRRIQPTSRLLEGLQSSMIISKIPSSSNDKSHRSHKKGASRANNGNRG